MGVLIVGAALAAGALIFGATSQVDTEQEGNWVAVIDEDVVTLYDKTTQEYADYVKVCAQMDVANHKKKKRVNGYARRSDVEELLPQQTNIPANFAGLEAVDVPTRLEDQLFRVYDISEEDDGVVIRARHVWYDNRENHTLWTPDQNQKYSAGDACRNILTNALSPVASRVATDCTDQMPGKDLDFARKNLIECFLDPQKGICAKYGLSLIRDNWDFYVLKDVGYDRGIVIQDKKNLLGVKRHENFDDVVTRLAPYAKDDKGNILWMNNSGLKYLDSSHINDYSRPRSLIYDSGLQIGKNDVTAQNVQEKLLADAQKRYDEEHIDLPAVDMEIEFISLGDTEEYAQYRDLDKVYLYDILTVVNSERGYNYTAQVVGVVHDLLTGMLKSVTIGKLNNWDGVRKIASWQVPEINGENIRLKSILAGAYADASIAGAALMNGIITADHIAAHTITADEIAAGTITANEIDVDDLAAAFADINVLTVAIADIAEATIENADIGFAQIKDADIQNLIAHDAVTDRYFIDKLAVRSAQMVQATVGELIVKASDNKYYRLDIDEYGVLTPTEVTSSLTAAEIAAGETSDGHSAIIETDLAVGDLSASNMKAINALIDKITASRIDVQELFARQATITQLNTVDIRGNQYLQLMVAGYGSTYNQWTDPATEQGNTVKNGDVWFKTAPVHTYSEMATKTHSQLASYTYKGLEGYVEYLRQSGVWVMVDDPVEARHQIAMISFDLSAVAIRVEDTWVGLAQIRTRVDQISLSVADKYGIQSGIDILSAGVAVSGNKYIKLDVNANNYVHIDQNGIDVKGNRIKVNGNEIFARDDIIIMNPNATDSWRRTVAQIENHMAGLHDWVMIRPFYDASINYVGSSGASQTQSVITNQYTESGSSGRAFGGQADWYDYVVTLNLYNGASSYRALNVQVYLSNKPFSLSPSGDRRSEAAAQANVILPEVTGTISGNGGTLTLTLDSGHVGYNLCGENQKLYYYIYGLNYESLSISSQGMVATTDTTNGKVACTTYYYP